ncbi:hypothetical protein BKA93DRAFT_806546 [Sparassis latifolia]
MKNHEIMVENRLHSTQHLNEMSEGLATHTIFYVWVRYNALRRSSTKELASRYKCTLQDSEIATEKIKNNFDVTGEELERFKRENLTVRPCRVVHVGVRKEIGK